MLCVYDKSIKTRHCDFIHFQGHKFAKGIGSYSDTWNHKFAIAGFSWSIVCNNNNYNYGTKNYYNQKPHYLADRGNEYRMNEFFERAIADYNRAIKVDSRCYDAYCGWNAAYSRKREIDYYGKGIDLINIRNKIYKGSASQPGADKNCSDHIFEDLWLAVNMDGTPNAIRFANRGILRIADGDWDQALQDFYFAIDADLFLADAYAHVGHEFYDEGIAELKNAISLDIAAAKSEFCESPKKTIICDFPEFLAAFIDEQKPTSTKKCLI